jgi:hypothetical protein
MLYKLAVSRQKQELTGNIPKKNIWYWVVLIEGMKT